MASGYFLSFKLERGLDGADHTHLPHLPQPRHYGRGSPAKRQLPRRRTPYLKEEGALGPTRPFFTLKSGPGKNPRPLQTLREGVPSATHGPNS